MSEIYILQLLLIVIIFLVKLEVVLNDMISVDVFMS
jgi:hypothetical protein